MAWSRGKKVLVGCLLAVAAVVVAVVVMIAMFVSWLRTPGPDLEAQGLITADTGFYFRLRLAEEDLAVRELIRVWARAQNQLGRDVDLQSLPPIIGNLLPMMNRLGQREVPDKDLDKMLPMQLVMTAPRTVEGDPELLFAFNAPGMGNSLRLVDWILGRVGSGDSDIEVRQHDDERLYRLGGDTPAWVCIAGTDALIATDPLVLEAALDRRALPAAPDLVPADMAEAMAPFPGDALLQVAGVAGLTGPLTEVILDRPAPALAAMLRQRLGGAEQVSGWAHLEGPDRLVGRLLVTGGAGASEPLATWTLELLDGSVMLRVSEAGMNIEGQSVLDIELTGVEALVEWGAHRLSRPGMRIGGGS